MPNPPPGTIVIQHAWSFHFLYGVQQTCMYIDLHRLWFVYYKNTHVRIRYFNSPILSFMTQYNTISSAVPPTLVFTLYRSWTKLSETETMNDYHTFQVSYERPHRSLTHLVHRSAFSCVQLSSVLVYFPQIQFSYNKHKDIQIVLQIYTYKNI